MKKVNSKMLSLFLVLIFTFSTLMINLNIVKATNLDENQIFEVQKEVYREALDKEKDLNKIVRVMVQLKEHPVVKNKNTTEHSIMKNQETIKAKALDLEGAELRHSYGYLVNGFSMDVKRSEIEKIEKMYGVENVREVNVYQPCMTTAKELTQVYDTWEKLKLKGEGMVVAVLDTGIDVTHKDMRLTDESKVTLNKGIVDGCIATNKLKGEYYTAKIPYAYNYADDSNEVIDTRDSESHGMHVAGIVGANGKPEEVNNNAAIQGVAPECQIMAMKVFPNKDPESGAAADDIVKAIEDSVKLGADVINMSLGGTAGFQDENDIEQKIIKNAADTGVLVVVSAGNSYYSTNPKKIPGLVDTGLVGAPGIAKDALQVASYENSKVTTVGFEYTSLDGSGTMNYSYSEEANAVQTLKDTNGYELVDCGPGNKDEDYNAQKLKGKIALIEKVDGTFGDRKLKAQNAGAIGAIIYTDEGNEGLTNVSVKKEVKIPCLYVGHTSGIILKNLISKGLRVKFNGKIVVNKNGDGNDMSDFTSWGPAPNLEFKPQITGVGGNINSTNNNNGYALMGGTSMSSPHVAGAEALILQSIKSDKKATIKDRELVELAKATSINTSIPIMDKHHKDVPYSPRRQGAGLIQIKNAIDNRVLVKGADGKPTIALKEIGKEKSFEVNLKNYSNEDITYNVNSFSGVLTEDNKELKTKNPLTLPFDIKIDGASLTYENEGKSLAVDGKSSIVVKANGEKALKFKVMLPEKFDTEQFVEGFIRFESINKEKAPSVGIPFIGFYGNWSKPTIIDEPAWDEASVTKKSFLIESAEDGLYISGYTGKKDADGNYIINKDKIFVSPNGDGEFDNVLPQLFFFRNVKTVGGEIQNSDGQIVRHFKDGKPVSKGEGLEGEDSKAARLFNLKWDGKLDNGTIAPDGEYKLVVKSTVDLENAQPQKYYLPVKIDATAPKLEIISQKNTETKKYLLKFKAQDALVGLSKIVVNLNGQNIDKTLISNVDNIYSCELELKDGYNQINVSASDIAKNTSAEELIVKFGNAELDKQPPTIDLLSKPGSTVNDYTFVCDVKDNASGVGSVSIELNGEKIDPLLINKTGKTYKTNLKLKNGKNIIKVTAEDNEKNSISKEFNIEVKEDKEGPIVELLSPETSSIKKYTLKFKMVDELSDLDFYLLTVNGNLLSDKQVKKDGDIYSSDLELKDGDNSIKISAYDKCDNATRKTFIIKVGDPSKDSVAPKIELTSASTTKISKYKFTANITDDLSSIEIVYMWLNDNKIQGNKIVKTGNEYSSELELKEGYNKVKVVATDSAKNEATKEFSIKYDKNATGEDKDDPIVELVSPKISNTSKYTLQCKVTDASGIDYVAYKVNGVRKSTITEEIVITGDIYSLETELNEGDNKIEVVAKDKKGNYKFSDFTVKYEKGGPVVPTLSIKLKESNIVNGEAKVSFDVINTTEKSEKLTLILALYDNNNNFISYKVESIEVGKQKQQALLSNTIKLDPKATRLKCFVWDSLEGMNPFIDATEIAIPKK